VNRAPPRPSALAFAALGALGLLAVLGAASVGAVHIPLADTFAALRHGPRGDADWASLVVLRVRLPRAIVAYLVGGALSVAGGALQGVFRNPLAEPGVLGVSNGAALGAVLVIFTGLSARMPAALPLAACAGAIVVTALLLAFAARGAGGAGSLLLAGIGLANLAAAGTTLTISLSLANYDVGRQVLQWLLGGLEARTWDHVAMGTAPILAAVALVLVDSRKLDALLLGDGTAIAVGVAVVAVRRRLVIATAVLTGIAVAIGGAIGFVGLIAPHVARRLVGAGHTRLLPACFLGGGAFLVLADVVARTLMAPQELRLGVITAVVGAPFFLVLLVRQRSTEVA
jgi:iron complex transport system permease protein